MWPVEGKGAGFSLFFTLLLLNKCYVKPLRRGKFYNNMVHRNATILRYFMNGEGDFWLNNNLRMYMS